MSSPYYHEMKTVLAKIEVQKIKKIQEINQMNENNHSRNKENDVLQNSKVHKNQDMPFFYICFLFFIYSFF